MPGVTHGLAVLTSRVGGTVSKSLDAKMEKMLKAAFGTDPTAIRQRYDVALTLIEQKNGSFEIPKKILEEQANRSLVIEPMLPEGQIPIDVSTDDWPFF